MPDYMPVNKVSQLTATIVNYPYLEKEHPVAIPVPLMIEKAVYYNPAQPSDALDVEPYLSRLVVNNRLEFIVENEVFGGNRNDPAPGVVKELHISYSYNGIKSEFVCKEKATVVILAY